MPPPLTSRERLRRVLRGQSVDRLPCIEWAAWWNLTVQRWHDEGLDRQLDGQDLVRHCGLDPMVRLWPRAVHWECPYRPAHHGAGLLEAAGGDFSRIAPHLGRWPWIPEWFSPHRATTASGETILWASADGFFMFPRMVFGIEAHLFAFYDEPDLMQRMNAIHAAWIPRWFEEVGIDGVLPLERQAGVDLPALRRQHPEFLFLGAFDKLVMHRGEDAIRAEFDRLFPALVAGRFIPSVDHQTPPEVPFADYLTYARCLREFAVRAAQG